MKKVSLPKIYTRLVSEVLILSLSALMGLATKDVRANDSLIPKSIEGG